MAVSVGLAFVARPVVGLFQLAMLCGLAACAVDGTGPGSGSCAHPGIAAQPYASPLRDGLTPSPLGWAGREWRVNAGSSRRPGMPYAIAISPSGERLRVELRNTPGDNSAADSATVRRAELSGSLYGDDTRLPNGTQLWGAFSFIHHQWEDPAGMRDLQGGVYGQIHMGTGVGGSPALAFRRAPDGKLRITTRGQFDPEGTTVFEDELAFDEVHDLVYRVVLDPAGGSLSVWLDGEPVVERQGLSVGHSAGTSYWNIGAYFARGISGRVVAEYANHVYPSPAPLPERVAAQPCWPAG